MPRQIVALITEISAPAEPAHPIVIPPDKPGGPPVEIWPDPPEGQAPHPGHPIAPGGPPPVVSHPIPPIVWPDPPDGGPPIAIDPGHPAHPIVLPPVVWPPPGQPAHPIVLPLPPEIWPSPGRPAHPIVIPPEDPVKGKLFTWYTGWTENHGWVVVAVPNFPHPAPAGAKKP